MVADVRCARTRQPRRRAGERRVREGLVHRAEAAQVSWNVLIRSLNVKPMLASRSANRLLEEANRGNEASRDDQRADGPTQRLTWLRQRHPDDQQNERLGCQAEAVEPGDAVMPRNVDRVQEEEQDDRGHEPPVRQSLVFSPASEARRDGASPAARTAVSLAGPRSGLTSTFAAGSSAKNDRQPDRRRRVDGVRGRRARQKAEREQHTQTGRGPWGLAS